MNQTELANRASIGIATIKRIELMTDELRGNVQTIVKIRRALEAAGVVFIDQDETQGPGVRLSKPLP